MLRPFDRVLLAEPLLTTPVGTTGRPRRGCWRGARRGLAWRSPTVGDGRLGGRCRRCDRSGGFGRSGLGSNRLGSSRLGGGLLLFRRALLGGLLRRGLRLFGGFLDGFFGALLGLRRFPGRFLGGLLRRFLRGFLLRRYSFLGLFGLLAFLALLRFSHCDPPVAADPCPSGASNSPLGPARDDASSKRLPVLFFV